MNKELQKLYEKHYPNLTKEMFLRNQKLEKESERSTNPLLLNVSENYMKADLRVMFFGQETNYWHTEMDGTGQFHGEISPLLNLYENFYIKGNCYSYGGQFWNGINRFKQLLNKTSKDNNFEFIWNNVVKIGKCGKGFPSQINDITNKYFNVISDEIKITKPDILVFLSGPYYDNEIKKTIGDFKSFPIDSFPQRKLCRLEFKDKPIAFRTYHPNYLWRNGIDNYFNAIINEIKTTKC